MHSILVLIRPSLYRQLFTPAADAQLRSLGSVHFQQEESQLTSDDVAARIAPCDIVITGWGTPRFTNSVMTAAGRLKLIAHAAGSVKFMLPDQVIDSPVFVSHSAIAMVQPVAELTLLMILTLLRQTQRHDHLLKSGHAWDAARNIGMGRELRATRVGVVGAGQIGRAVMSLLRALQVDVSVYDPYLNDAVTDELGVRKTDLDSLLADCPVVSLHAPSTAETRHMIGARELALLQDDACLVNTARSWLVDQDALLAELRAGRIRAAMDVFDTEPLPPESPFRSLPNVLLTPHIGSLTTDAYFMQGQVAVDEVQRYVNHQPLRHRINMNMYKTMA